MSHYLNFKVIKVFRQNLFEQPFERTKFRKICNELSEKFQDSKEDVYIFAGVDLPESNFESRWEGQTMKKKVQASPDIFILKNNGAVVVETKNYPGTISWNNHDLDLKHSWKSKLGTKPSQIINEGTVTPHEQLKYNRQALIGFLQTYDKKFISKDLKDNQYYKAKGCLLFTHDSVKFAQSYHLLKDNEKEDWAYWDYNLSICSLSKENNSDYFVEYIQDEIVTPSRQYYKKKDRKNISKEDLAVANTPCIAFDLNSIKKIAKILKCEDVTKQYIGQFKEEENIDFSISTGVGFAPTLIRSRDDSIENLDKIPTPSASILKLPEPLKILAYYKQAMLDESKTQNMELFLNSRNAKESIFIFRDMYDTIFSKQKSIPVPEDKIQDIDLNLKREDPSLSYGLGLMISSKIFNRKTFFTAEPLFSTSVEFNNGKYSPALINDITINDGVLRRLRNFDNITRDQFFEKKDNLIQKYLSPKELIKAVYSEIGLNDSKFDPFKIGSFISSNHLENGFKPNTAAIYRSQSNYYKRLISELDYIFDDWKEKHQSGKKIKDLAYQFLNGFENSQYIKSKNTKWKPTLFNILESNYEQSQSVSTAVHNRIPISIVSGPPGTGKSQLSINAIAEMNYKDKSVIFSSKNKKAVDVVSNKMNAIAPNSIEHLNTGSNTSSYNKFEHKPLTASQRQKYQSLLNKKNIEFQKLKNNIELYQKAAVDSIKIEENIMNILNENSTLHLINWHTEDASILKVEYWKNSLGLIDKSEKKGFFARAIEVLSDENENYSFFDILDKDRFIDKNKIKITSELKNNLPKAILNEIGEDQLIKFSKKYLFLIEELAGLNSTLLSYNKILNGVDEDTLFSNWNKLSKSNTNTSLKLYHDKVLSINKKFTNSSITSLSIGKVIPLKPGIFDLGIIDEASQTDIISTIPILYRSKKILIIGDEKQLNPIISLHPEKDYENWKAYQLPIEKYDKFNFSENSLLSTASKAIESLDLSRSILREHYRCHPDIINFSNYFFYDNLLRIQTKSDSMGGVEIISHDGDCEQPKTKRSWLNKQEIDIVIEKLKELKTSYSSKEIGVVTPFKAQSEEIKNQISKIDIFSETDILNLTIDTAHKFQGDEKEVMIYSLTAGPSMRKETYDWMAGNNINNPSERNLINVAITRARKKLIIIGNENFILEKKGLLTELINWSHFCNRS
tara:strand:+ start:100 stop:3666 length:3567 start_codon:yes stop_codon:yes gene_type:complete